MRNARVVLVAVAALAQQLADGGQKDVVGRARQQRAQGVDAAVEAHGERELGGVAREGEKQVAGGGLQLWRRRRAPQHRDERLRAQL
jgi:hypothetical protein